MRRGTVARTGALTAMIAALAGCSGSDGPPADPPGLDPRGTVLTTVTPKRQDLTNRISLTGKVTIGPVFGIVAPLDGEVRYVNRQPSATPATRPLWVASVWQDGRPRRVEIPADSTFAGRLMADRSLVKKGMPVASARLAGYGIVADIDSAQAYRLAGAVTAVRAQITNGPGPFPCTAMGTIAALPPGTIPEPPAPPTPPAGGATGSAAPVAPAADPPAAGAEASEETGLRLVCTPPDTVKLINGAAVTLDVVTAKASKAMVLPVEAVAGVQGRGKVDVVGPDRTRKTVDVVLGLTDGKVVQITSGLKGDETVAVPGPDLPAPPPGEENQSGAGG